MATILYKMSKVAPAPDEEEVSKHPMNTYAPNNLLLIIICAAGTSAKPHKVHRTGGLGIVCISHTISSKRQNVSHRPPVKEEGQGSPRFDFGLRGTDRMLGHRQGILAYLLSDPDSKGRKSPMEVGATAILLSRTTLCTRMDCTN